ncbi:hypothetical protein CANARDRAFT_26423 [[Candida] arabinofermentans NRRL YB-2248]|uniref:SHSP domain-containing protein n=1 Tax=[Candida] arabinofermentans NRRL YB-2248 TaxID=983967 RepID=A0A1E4T914_9ASCO|nr:hypothetical protein CANARDRAFT_26423 [[Candida] arabinofermentans NRRL YB-2248]
MARITSDQPIQILGKLLPSNYNKYKVSIQSFYFEVVFFFKSFSKSTITTIKHHITMDQSLQQILTELIGGQPVAPQRTYPVSSQYGSSQRIPQQKRAYGSSVPYTVLNQRSAPVVQAPAYTIGVPSKASKRYYPTPFESYGQSPYPRRSQVVRPRYPVYEIGGYDPRYYTDQPYGYYAADDDDDDEYEQADIDNEDGEQSQYYQPQEQQSSKESEDAQYRTLEDLFAPYFTRSLTNQQPQKYSQTESVPKVKSQPTEPQKGDEADVDTGSNRGDSANDSKSSEPEPSQEDTIKELLLNALKKKEANERAQAQTLAQMEADKPRLAKRKSSIGSLQHVRPEGLSSKVDPLQVSAPQLKTNLPFSPPLNVYEFPENYIVSISLPGVSKEFVDISYHPTSNEIVVKGEVQNKYLSDDITVDNTQFLKVSEQRFGSFERIVKLPAFPPVDEDSIQAKFNNGLLEIKVAKVKEDHPKKTAKKIVLEDVPDEEILRESQVGYI